MWLYVVVDAEIELALETIREFFAKYATSGASTELQNSSPT